MHVLQYIYIVSEIVIIIYNTVCMYTVTVSCKKCFNWFKKKCKFKFRLFCCFSQKEQFVIFFSLSKLKGIAGSFLYSQDLKRGSSSVWFTKACISVTHKIDCSIQALNIFVVVVGLIESIQNLSMQVLQYCTVHTLHSHPLLFFGFFTVKDGGFEP